MAIASGSSRPAASQSRLARNTTEPISAVLGAVMSAKISSLLPASWHAAHLPALTPAQLDQVKSAASVGVAPVTHSTPPQIASVITDISHAAFLAGMHNAFLVGAGVALAGAVIGLATKRGNGAAGVQAGGLGL